MSAARLKHFGWGREGEGLTAEETIHGEEMLLRVPCVGEFDP
jgi:hypothetical protein